MKKIRIIIIIVAILLVGVLLMFDFNPSGIKVFTSWAGVGNAAIRPLVPANRVQQESGRVAKIVADPVYLDVRLPQKYDSLTLELEVNNPQIPLLQAGLKVQGEGDWNFYLQPLQHRQLDLLPWPKITNGSLTLWQKYPKYSSIQEFLNNLDGNNRLATFNYDLKRDYYLPNYLEPRDPLIINRTLRGPLQLAVYVAPSGSAMYGDLNIKFKLQDINRQIGEDPIALYVTDQTGRTVYSDLLSDDGFTSDRSGASSPRQLNILVSNLRRGVYFIELRCNQDIFTRQIVSAHHKLIFQEQLYLADNAEYADGFLDLLYQPVTLITNGREFSFRTAHPKGYQTIYVNGRSAANLNIRHKEYFVSTTTPFTTIKSPLNDVQIATNGWLAFSYDQFFDPGVYSVNEFPQLTAFDYLLAKYVPQIADGWHIVKADFPLTNVDIYKGRLRLLISSSKPSGQAGELLIRRAKITLHKPPLTFNNVIDLLKRWVISWIKPNV